MGNMTEILENYVKNTISLIVDRPEDVKVVGYVTTKAVIIQIKVDEKDCGKVIGKKGRTIDALKVICSAIKNTKFPNDSKRVLVEILEGGNFKYPKN